MILWTGGLPELIVRCEREVESGESEEMKIKQARTELLIND